MAVLPRGLCIVLTVGMVCSRPSASIRAGTSFPGSQAAAKERSAIHEVERKLRAVRDLPGLESLYQKALELARVQHGIRGQIDALTSLGNVYVLSYRYPLALANYLEARRFAEDAGDQKSLGFINLNLSSLYQELGDSGAALATAEAAHAAVERAGPTFYQAQIQLMLGRLYASRQDSRAEGLYLEGIEAARRQNDVPNEAQGWDLLGENRLARGDLEGADRAITEAFRLRTLHDRADLRLSYRRLGALRLAQGLPNEPKDASGDDCLKEAMRLTRKALAASQADPGLRALLLHQVGQIQQAQGDEAEAIQSYGAAVDQAARWWSILPMAGSALTGANAALQRRVFDSYVEAAAGRARRTSNFRLAAESFLAEEFNRASSLRETQALAPVWRSKLPPAYWETLSELRAEDAREMRGGGDPLHAERLRLRISEMETLAGIGFSLSKNENFHSVDSLSHFQEGLKQSEILLSFHLGPRASYLWAVTRTTLRLYQLDSEDRIGRRAREFREAVSGNRQDRIGALGRELYDCLFGQLSPDEVARPAWLMSVEGPLFEVPFAALVRARAGTPGAGSEGWGPVYGESEYLVERNSVQIVPGALLLHSASGKPGAAGRLVAVGDPVYNRADARYSGAGFKPASWLNWSNDAGGLSRLAESGSEVIASAEAWNASRDPSRANQALVLTGTAAGQRQFLEALQPAPAVIHLATHVLTPPQRLDQAFVAFSLSSSGQPELLATSDIARLQVPETLVVMTGCATAAGEAREGAGLLGLTRAWLMAGASGAIATSWAVSDSAGDLLPAFYRYWKTSSSAEALRLSQVDMIRERGWRSAPSYWAAYQFTGGER